MGNWMGTLALIQSNFIFKYFKGGFYERGT